ncbi:tRNA1(Val) (adenine(37)-N6)-methyltransferase [Roseivivax sp. THAF30]|uniref:tRNA1(Val) (adenine(37)-N6)-methyltransferase n=1 Tax=Roseivivax sp. THAF30 TaxID=2587852 RepID=UPI0012AA35D7|nr:methyltransferase [Roseivivax sp. THAF30]QFT61743.1 tRNA1(Val) (adenine(37)-N6)-methyltransferase [Roseivivax sp. THAF30]
MTADGLGFAEAELSHDAFLGGRITLYQPKSGYRAGIDPILLAASVPARRGERVLDLGCGAGPALLALGARVPGLSLTGLERQAAYADLAVRNAGATGIAARIFAADLREMPAELRAESFDHIIANPPYFQAADRTAARDAGREAGRGEETPLADWVRAGSKRLAPAGRLTMIVRAERLPELLDAMQGLLGSLEVQPLAPRTGRAARLVLVRGRKGGRAEFRLHAPIVLHEGSHHVRDGEDYAPRIRAVLREAAALHFGASDQ